MLPGPKSGFRAGRNPARKPDFRPESDKDATVIREGGTAAGEPTTFSPQGGRSFIPEVQNFCTQ